MLKIHFPKVLFSEDDRFSLLVASIVFAAGFHLSGSADRLLTALRQQVLTLLKWLALVATAILVLFTIALALRTPNLLASHRHVISATWLLWLAVVTVYLYNAGYQDGDTSEPYPRSLGRLLRYAAPLLVLISGMALYALIVRVRAYGLTVSRIWGLLVAILSLAYAIGYSLSARRATPWMQGMGRTNVAVALLLLTALALLLSPLLPPDRLAANSLSQRMLQARAEGPDRDAFMVLRFDTGVYGREELARLANAAPDPDMRKTAAAALAVRSPMNRYEFEAEQNKSDAARLVFRIFPEGQQVDEGLRAAIAANLPARSPVQVSYVPPPDENANEAGDFDTAPPNTARRAEPPCRAAAPCPVLFIALDDSEGPEAVAFWEDQVHAYHQTAGHWSLLRSVQSSNCRRCAEQTLHELEAGHYQALKAPWRDLEIGKRRIVITERPGQK